MHESYLFVKNSTEYKRNTYSSPGTPNKNEILLQERTLENTDDPKLLNLLQNLRLLDYSVIEPMLNYYIAERKVYVTSKYIGQGRNDLFRFASFK